MSNQTTNLRETAENLLRDHGCLEDATNYELDRMVDELANGESLSHVYDMWVNEEL